MLTDQMQGKLGIVISFHTADDGLTGGELDNVSGPTRRWPRRSTTARVTTTERRRTPVAARRGDTATTRTTTLQHVRACGQGAKAAATGRGRCPAGAASDGVSGSLGNRESQGNNSAIHDLKKRRSFNLNDRLGRKGNSGNVSGLYKDR